MRVLTGEEVDRLERASLPTEQRPAPILCSEWDSVLALGYVRQEFSRVDAQGCDVYRNDITPRGQLALRCHRAFLASKGATT